MKLTDNLYAYVWENPYENNCNSFYLGGTVQALVDPGLTEHLPGLLTRMEEDGIAREAIRYVISTHSHPDHFEASHTFNGRSDVTIALGAAELSFYLTEGRMLYRYFGLDAPDVEVNLKLLEGAVTMGKESIEIIDVPGHSPGSIALYWPSEKALISGDVIFDQNVGRTDFPGGDGELLKKSIRRLSSLDVEYLLPGHIGIVKGTRHVRDNFRFVIERIIPYL